ncbi:MAG: hypothetical protein H6686_12790 [Fibrobacteria bacterium]|nr:hypothetical protein [Fibrobacteria bacterium]
MRKSINSREAMTFFFLFVLVLMTAATTWASLEKNVFKAFVDLGSDRWGLATLMDAYFGFLAVWLLTAARKPGWTRRILWLVAFLCLGNFAIAAWMLAAMRGWDGTSPLHQHLLKSERDEG